MVRSSQGEMLAGAVATIVGRGIVGSGEIAILEKARLLQFTVDIDKEFAFKLSFVSLEKLEEVPRTMVSIRPDGAIEHEDPVPSNERNDSGNSNSHGSAEEVSLTGILNATSMRVKLPANVHPETAKSH